MSINLKIKSKSLAAEARIIRKEEHKLLTHARAARKGNYSDPAPILWQRASLRDHRVSGLRQAARETHLARAVLAGRPYAATEQPVRKMLTDYQHKKIVKMVNRYGDPESEAVTVTDIIAWIAA